MLRTTLSLLGVTIGIFAIIGVFALVDSMEANIKGMISDMGDDLVMVGKWPMTIEEGETEYPWWKYLQCFVLHAGTPSRRPAGFLMS